MLKAKGPDSDPLEMGTLAKVIYDAFLIPENDDVFDADDPKTAMLEKIATRLAVAIVEHITDNGEVKIANATDVDIVLAEYSGDSTEDPPPTNTITLKEEIQGTIE